MVTFPKCYLGYAFHGPIKIPSFLVSPPLLNHCLFCFQVLEREQIMNKYHEVTAKLEQALSGISYEILDISDEVKEQVEHFYYLFLIADVDN